MARCNSCSAPLPANANKCIYCGIRNDVDLTGKHDYAIHEEASNRICPHCNIGLQTIALKLKEDLFIERCERCFGLFFDPDEVEKLLESSVSKVFNINLKHLININRDRYRPHQKIKYIKCPVCQHFMSRVNFGHRSGVIVDRCKAHGIWLDNGEITHLMEWKKAGGQLLHVQRSKNQEKHHYPSDNTLLPTNLFKTSHNDKDLLMILTSAINKLFS
ncbi:MAG: TFIIB-type zinc ribbon-containing protein [Gammaproteobacteria bacterium]